MTRSIIAFFSLGMTCGPEVGRYGRFDVELTPEEDARIEEVIRDHKPGYIRTTLKERYPELHQKIVDASAAIKRDITIYCLYETGAFFSVVDDENESEFWDAPFSVQIDTICESNGFTREEIDIDDVATCYYLTEQELPGDFEGRGGCLNDEHKSED